MKVQWPKRAASAIALLFQPLQDVDVYVEDHGSEGFYSALLKLAAPTDVRVERVVPLGGRKEVISAAQRHDFSKRRAIFLIDGDFEWVRGEPSPSVAGLYRLDAYCVENILISASAAAQVLIDCEACTEDEAVRRIDYDSWRRQVGCLVALFRRWAALNCLDEAAPTTSLGLAPFLTDRPNRIDPQKVQSYVDSLDAIHSDDTSWHNILRRVDERVDALSDDLDIVSGKDFLLPALEFHLRLHTREKCSRKSLMIRLARYTSEERLMGLRRAISRAAKGRLGESVDTGA